MQSEQIDKLATALAKAQGEMRLPGKNREVTVKLKDNKGQYKFEYTTLDHMIEHVRPHLTSNGLWFVQTIGSDSGKSVLVTTLTHSSGQWISGLAPLITGGGENAAQAFGSSLTYMRRYALAAMLGIASEEDDDANAADGNTIAEKRERPPANGNGHTKPAEPAKRPVAGKPEDEATKWAAWATDYVNKQIKTPSALRKWEQANESGLTNLKLLDRAAWSDLNMLLEERHNALTAAQMSA